MRFAAAGDLHKSVFVFRNNIVFTQSRRVVVLSHRREHLTATKIYETDEPGPSIGDY